MSNRLVQGGLLTVVCGTYVSVVAYDRFGSNRATAVENAKRRGRDRGRAKFREQEVEEERELAMAAAAASVTKGEEGKR